MIFYLMQLKQFLFYYNLFYNFKLPNFITSFDFLLLKKIPLNLTIITPTSTILKFYYLRHRLKFNKFTGLLKFKKSNYFRFTSKNFLFSKSSFLKITQQKSFSKYKILFFNKFYPLVGNKLSYWNFNLKKSKTWLLNPLKFYVKKNLHLKYNNHKILQSNHSFDNTTRLELRNLSFIVNLLKHPKPKHFAWPKHSKPYMFLNSRRFDTVRKKSPFKSIFTKFLRHKKIFSLCRSSKLVPHKLIFKRLRSSSLNFRNWKDDDFLQPKIVSPLFIYNVLTPVRKIKRIKFTNFQFNNIYILKKKNYKKSRLFLVSNRRKFLRSNKVRYKFKILFNRYTKYFNSNLIDSSYLHLFYHLPLQKASPIAREIFNKFSVRNKLLIFFKLVKNFTLKKISTPFQFYSVVRKKILRKFSHSTIPVFKLLPPFSYSRLAKDLYFFNEPKANTRLKHNLLIFSRYKISFILSVSGFLLLSNPFSHVYKMNKIHDSSNYYKLIFSFILVQDVIKQIISRYSKTRSTHSLKNLSMSDSFFSHSDYSLPLSTYYNEGQRFEHANTSSIKSALTSKTDIVNQTDLPIINNLSFKIDHFNTFGKINITRVRLKPGYQKIWREARKSLLSLLMLNFRFQHRLTKFLLQYNRLRHQSFSAFIEMNILNLLVRARFALESHIAEAFILNSLVFVNGVICHNFNFQLFCNDFVQLIVSFKYYITYRWLLNNVIKLKKKIKFISWKSRNKKFTSEKKINKNLPLTALSFARLNQDVPKFIEVDFLTLSFFILYDPLFFSDFDILNRSQIRTKIFNMYNWKYIN